MKLNYNLNMPTVGFPMVPLRILKFRTIIRDIILQSRIYQLCFFVFRLTEEDILARSQLCKAAFTIACSAVFLNGLADLLLEY
jgi:hypothetical protein